MLFNGDKYTFFTSAVVNHPVSYAVHRFLGAYPLRTYHFNNISPMQPPFYNVTTAVKTYFGCVNTGVTFDSCKTRSEAASPARSRLFPIPYY